MNDDTKRILATMRGQAWHRAKGELHAVLATFYADDGKAEDEFDKLNDRIDQFIIDVEEYGLHE